MCCASASVGTEVVGHSKGYAERSEAGEPKYLRNFVSKLKARTCKDRKVLCHAVFLFRDFGSKLLIVCYSSII